MLDFIRAYNERGERSTVDVLSDTQIGIWADRGSADPAQLYDFLDAYKRITAEQD
jgi:hypothetical protein